MSDLYAVIGNPIGHSKSPLIHRTFATLTGQDMVYTAIDAPLDAFARTVEDFCARGGLGLNITTPFKLQAFDLATERRERAQLAGAANALKLDGERIVADNFDGVGLVSDIQRNLGVAIGGQRVLMLGTGGAVRGALLPFLAQRPAALVLCSRDGTKARALAEQFRTHGKVEGCSYADLAGSRFDIVLNATSASMTGERPPVPDSAFGGAALAYELVYGRGLTPFLRRARSAGALTIADGVGMLVEQAAEAFEWWRGVRPDTRSVIDELTVPLV